MQAEQEEIRLPFSLAMGGELLRKGARKDENGDDYAEFDGIVSTEDPDVQGDIIVQKGVDWDHFRKHGVFDWEHGKEPDDIIGKPLEVRTGILSKGGVQGTYVRGKLLLKQEKARKAYELMKALASAGHQMGFSVLGKGVRDTQDRRKIVKSLFSRIAFTVTPVNPFTGGGLVTVVKSLGAITADGTDPAAQEPAKLATAAGVTLPEFRELVRKSLGEIKGLNCETLADTLFARALAAAKQPDA